MGAYQLVLEVTESVFFDADCNVIKQLSRLRDAGVRVALDDFGTGYSSLGRLQDLPVDTVKIDRTFVSMVRTGAERLPILSSMINMAHSLGLTVTAEGVETADAGGLPDGPGVRFAAGLPVLAAGAGRPVRARAEERRAGALRVGEPLRPR